MAEREPTPKAQPTAAHAGGVTIRDVSGELTVMGDIVGGDKITHVYKADPRERRELLILLERVHEFWVEGVLERSLHREALIELSMAVDEDSVAHEHPWEFVVHREATADRKIAPGTDDVVELFDDADGGLLILGEPGSGKTTLLLQLARDLIMRARGDPQRPIPVLFNLSSWSATRAELSAWLAEELRVRYQIPARRGADWVAHGDLTPLLDGLDEVSAEDRAACVEAINNFRTEHGLAQVVVCSRSEEYEALPAPLALETAVVIQPLGLEQIQRHLAGGGTALAGLAEALRNDAELLELARSPLMLDVMSMAYRDASSEALSGASTASGSDRRATVMTAYVARMFDRVARTQSQPFSQSQTVHWLRWLAHGMAAHSQTVFLLDQLQPSWLATRRQRWVYSVATRLAGALLIGLAVGLLGGFSVVVFALERPVAGALPPALPFMLILTSFVGLCAGLVSGLLAAIIEGARLNRTVLPTPARTKMRLPIRGLTMGFLFGSVTAAVLGILGGLVLDTVQFIFTATLFMLTYGVFGGFLFETALAPSATGARGDVRTVDRLHWSWRAALRGAERGLRAGFVGGALFGVLGSLLADIYYFGGAQAAVKAPGGLLATLLAALIFGLLFGSIGGLIAGPFAGLRGQKVERQATLGRGMRRSTRNALFATAVTAPSVGLAVGLVVGLIRGVIAFATADANAPGLALSVGLGIAVVFTSGVGLVSLLHYGLLDVVKHYTLRVLLWRAGSVPGNVADFLDHTVELIFLRRVGGGYIFIHRLLLEYFASPAETGPPPAA